MDTVRNIYEIMDTKTGKIQQLEQKYIIQELKRPTMSEVLPLDKKANVDDRLNKSVVLELFLRKHYAANDLIFLEDVKTVLDIQKLTREYLGTQEQMTSWIAEITKERREYDALVRMDYNP